MLTFSAGITWGLIAARKLCEAWSVAPARKPSTAASRRR
jgi:hypothetical protein